MAYIGQGIKEGTFSVLDTSGNTYNGSNVTFSLGTQVGSPAQLLVSHDGVIQKPGTDYTLATGGTQITFTTAPASGASIFIVEISGAVGGPLDSDLNGTELILDADGDTSITADTDDQIDFKIAGADDLRMTANAINVLSGTTLTIDSGATITNSGTANGFGTDPDGAQVFNESSADVDFRVEGNGEANLFYIDGGEDKIYSGISSKSVHAAGYEPHIQIEGTSDNKNSVSLTQNSNNNGAPSLIMCKTRGTSVGATTIVQDDDYLGNILFGGADGNDRQTYGAHIIARIEGTPGENDMPTELKFGTTADGAASPTDRVRITNGGCLKASTTSYTEASAGDFHELNNTTGNLILRMQNSNAAPYGNVIAFSAAAPDNNSNYFFKCFDNVATRVNIFADGDIQNHDNSYGSTSDVKLKEQISDASSQWNDIKNLRVRKFKLKDDISSKGDSNELWRIGLIAQEAETVSPNLVKDNPDLDQLTNEPTGTTTKAIKYSILYMKAVKALQEAMAKIESLEARVTTLEG